MELNSFELLKRFAYWNFGKDRPIEFDWKFFSVAFQFTSGKVKNQWKPKWKYLYWEESVIKPDWFCQSG